jgi:uncharacterized protein (TIGR03435 family)
MKNKSIDWWQCKIALAILGFIFTISLEAQGKKEFPPSALEEFSVASIHLEPEYSGVWKLQFLSDMFEARGASIKMLLKYALDRDDSDIYGAPSWAATRRFTINAKLDPEVVNHLGNLRQDDRVALQRRMVRNILVERFQLVFHEEDRDRAIYVVEVSKSGPRLRDATSENKNQSEAVSPNSDESDAPSLNVFAGSEIRAHKLPISILTKLLSSELGQSVKDETGLNGVYDFDLKWNSETDATLKALSNGAPDLNPRSDRADSERESRPSLSAALLEQLGLVLRYKRTSVRTVIIDHVQMPSAN